MMTASDDNTQLGVQLAPTPQTMHIVSPCAPEGALPVPLFTCANHLGTIATSFLLPCLVVSSAAATNPASLFKSHVARIINNMFAQS
jgi:hypothetical protein